jgi:hypothetical protein
LSRRSVSVRVGEGGLVDPIVERAVARMELDEGVGVGEPYS